MNEKTVVEKTVEYIETHLEEELSLDKIAKELNYSKFYIARTFSEKTGKTIYQYIQGRRLTIAAQKLVETEKTIMEIACEAQYNSQQAFTLAFTRCYLVSPQRYRKNGSFHPKQLRIGITNVVIHSFAGSYEMGGKMAA